MPRFFSMTASSCLALAFGAGTAMADLSATDVWSDWKDYISSFGYDLSGVEKDTGAGLSISGMSVKVPFPDGADGVEGSMTMTFGDVAFVEQGDGTVRVELSEQIDFAFDVEDEEAVSGTITYMHSDPGLIVSGEVDNLTYTYDTAKATMRMDGLTVDGVTVGPDVFSLNVVMDQVASTTTMAKGEMRNFDQTLSTQKVSYTFKFKDPEEGGNFDMQGEATGISFAGNGDLPLDTNTDNASALIQAGFAFQGAYEFTGGSTQVTFEAPDGSGTLNSTSSGSTLSMAMSGEGLSYDTETRDLTVNALFSTFPLPMTFEAGLARFDMLMPTVKAPEAQDFGMVISLSDFTMADALWGLFDPTAQLPRDPATVTLDLAGKAKLLFDYLDPAQAAVLEAADTAPGELEAVTLNELTVDAAGARLTGAGAFTFDNSDTTTFNGLPKPTGAVDLELSGGNGLLDKLVGIGLLPEDQAMGARMMMGLFARPGEGPDTLTSRIEVNDQGHVLANGQRIQ